MAAQSVLEAVASRRTAASKLSAVPVVRSASPALNFGFCDEDEARITTIPDAIRSIRTASNESDASESAQNNCLSIIWPTARAAAAMHSTGIVFARAIFLS